MTATRATFVIEMTLADGVLPSTGRFDFTKQWDGGLVGTSSGVLLSAGDPTSGNAGYVALELFTGRVDDHDGSFVLQQFGSLTAGEDVLHYEIVPGSGGGELAGIAGTIQLIIAEDGSHHVTLNYELTQPQRGGTQ